MKIFDQDSVIMKGMTRIGETIILNVLFVIFSLPIVTVGAALTAMYTVCFREAEQKSAPLWKTFRKAFKENFGKATALWLILLLIGGIIVYNLFMLAENPELGGGVIRVMVLVAGIFYLMICPYVFPLQSRYENTVFGTLRNSVALAFGRFPVTLLLVAMNIIPLVVAYFNFGVFLYLSILWFSAWFALIAQLTGRLLLKVFRKLTDEDEEEQTEDTAAADSGRKNKKYEAPAVPLTTYDAGEVAYFSAMSAMASETDSSAAPAAVSAGEAISAIQEAENLQDKIPQEAPAEHYEEAADAPVSSTEN